MILLEKIEALTEEEQEKIADARNEQELLAALSEAGIELTDEEKAEIARMSAPEEASRELTDEEVSAVSGGAWFKRCPNGVFEAGFRIWGNSKCKDCPQNVKPTHIAMATQWCSFFHVSNRRYSGGRY